jgi:ATP-binding cassette subfamily C protein CydC
MRALLPYLALYKRHKWMLTLGIVLAIVTLLASIGLLTLSGWFCQPRPSRALPGYTALTICSGGRRSRYRHHPYCRTLFRAAGQPRRHFPRAAAPAHLHLQQTAAPLPAGLARFRQGELLNRVVADVDTLDHLTCA